MADRISLSLDTTTGALKGISQTVPDNILAGGIKRAAGDVTIDAGGANSILLRTNGTTSVTITSGGKLTTSSTTTTPAILIGSFTADPSGLTNGDIWYNSTTNKFRAREAAASVDLISAGTASGWTDAGAEVHLTTSTDEVTVGASGGTAGKFTVVGDTAAQRSVVIKQAASQTAAWMAVQNSAGTDLHTMSGTTSVSYFYTTAASAVTSQTQDEVPGGGASGAFNFTTGFGGDASGGAAGVGGTITFILGQGGQAGTTGGETAAAGGGFTVIGGQGGSGDSTGTGGLNGATGGTFTIRSGAGGTAGSGGAAGYGGNFTIQTGDAGTVGSTFGITPGNGGTLTLRGGVGSTGDSGSFGGSGGPITLIGGIGGYAFSGSSFAGGPGGDISLTGGVGGDGNATVAATGGGYVYINGGTGGVDNGGGGGPGGNVVINGGNATGSQTDGTLLLGQSNTSSITIGASNIQVHSAGYLTSTASSTRVAVQVGSFAGDPSTVANGGLWYNTSTSKLRAYQASVAVDVIGGGPSFGQVVAVSMGMALP